ncbi:hypothetical protein, partial [Escherichia coli]|uniref:hypothetical protein n=1 Tax=Escherichia coli TaxID=562 RepID=UPI001C57438E
TLKTTNTVIGRRIFFLPFTFFLIGLLFGAIAKIPLWCVNLQKRHYRLSICKNTTNYKILESKS